MKIISGNSLVQTLRNMCDNAKQRLWIASPFIGDWNAIRRILGRKWLDEGNIDVKLLTDISDYGYINRKVFECFRNRGDVKTLKGLHAKIYIADDSAILTSANLTATAFSKRYEVGSFMSRKDVQSLSDLYKNWWTTLAEEIPLGWLSNDSAYNHAIRKFEKNGNGLKKHCNLPMDPGDPFSKTTSSFNDYNLFLEQYVDFANRYAKIQRRWSNTHLFFETDAFLNYLFHHATGTPTQKFIKHKPTNLNNKARNEKIKKYASLFKKWLSNASSDDETWRDNAQLRERSSAKIKRLLSKDGIETIRLEDIKQVVSRLNCMNSMPINKRKFLNPKNNDVKTIINAWKNLLYGREILPIRMSKCKNSLRFFGRSSIHELVGFFEPEKYPLRNTNSNAGLRFFGYDVSVY